MNRPNLRHALRIIPSLVLALCAACSRRAPEHPTLRRATNTAPLRTMSDARSYDAHTKAAEVRGAPASALPLHADAHSVSAMFCSVTERMELTLLNKKILEEKQTQDIEAAKKWEQEQRRLWTLYEQYSNRWDQIPNHKDRLRVVLCTNIERETALPILRELLQSRDKAVVAEAACQLRFVHENFILGSDAMRFYSIAEESFLGGLSFEDALLRMSSDERAAVSGFYEDKAMSLFQRNDHAGAAEAFTKMAEAVKGNPLRYAETCLDISSAFVHAQDKQNAMKALDECERCLTSIEDKRTKAQALSIWDELQEQKKGLRENDFGNFHTWYH